MVGPRTMPQFCAVHWGFPGGGAQTRAKGGGGKVWLEDVYCKGGEGDVGDCKHSGWGEAQCGHADDVGLCCWPSRTDAEKRERTGPSYFDRCPEFYSRDMRLTDCNRHVCRLEVKHRSEWGTVCDNGFTDTNANFVCKMMGFGKGIFKQACGTNGEFASCAENTGGAGRVWLDDVYCYGFEHSIDGCRHKPWGKNRCMHKQDVGVCCSGGAAEKLQQEILDAGSTMAGLNALEGVIEKVTGSVQADKGLQDAISSLGGAAAGKAFESDGIEEIKNAIIHLSQLSTFDATAFVVAIDASGQSDGMAALEKALEAAGGKTTSKSTAAIIQTSSMTIWTAMHTCNGSTAGPAVYTIFQKAVKAVSTSAVAVRAVQQAIIDGKSGEISQAIVAGGGSSSDAAFVKEAVTKAGGEKAAAVALKAYVAAADAKVAKAAVMGPPGNCPQGELNYDLKKGVAGFKSQTGGFDLGVIHGGVFEGANGFRFIQGEGLGVDPHGCIPVEDYTIYMRVKLEQTIGTRFLVHSPGWEKEGLVVNNNLMINPSESELLCEETIMPNTWYQFVLTRSKDAKITLYVHGGRCSEGVSEKGEDWLNLSPHSIQFFFYGQDNADGHVTSIRVFNESLTEEKVAEICSCTLPDKGTQCKYTLVMNTVPAGTKYSSIGPKPVSNGRLGSSTGWLAGANDQGEWMQFDTGFEQSILGVVTQGRKDTEAWVKTFKVAVSKDEKAWTWVGCGRVFDANIDRNSRVENLFYEPVFARYVRIFPESWKNSIGMRAGAIVCELPCWKTPLGAELEYKFQLSFLSSTMGPDLIPSWGEGDFLPIAAAPNTEFYYKFETGQGLSLNQERCINQTAWTIFMHFALDETTGGYKRVLTSGGWGDYGMYVNKYLMLVPKASRMRCFERIRAGKFYRVYVTRDEDGKLALYINGAECASGNPPYKDHFQLNPASVTFFKDDSGEDIGGSLKEIKLWDKALNATEVELHSGCKRPEEGKRCKYTVVFNSPISRTTYTSIRSGSPGKGLGRGRLNSKQAWCTASNNKGQYMEADMGFLQNITGFVTQGRRDADEWVTSYSVKASQDGVTWTDVGCGTEFEGNTDRKTKVKNFLHRPIVARYLRIYPESWHAGMCMRAGFILCEKPCVDGEMDYDFDGSMVSVTGGPSLDPAWGDGIFEEDGYHFENGLGMEVETQRCLMNNTITTAYTVFMEVTLDSTIRPQILMTSDGWDQGGLVVDSWLGLAPSGTNMVCEEQQFHAGKKYKITMTRTTVGKITLYLNGAECASGEPPFFNYYRLKKERVVFFHDDNEKNLDPDGVVRRIVLLKRALDKDDVAKLNGCTLPDEGSKCEQDLVLNAVYKSITYSSVQGGAAVGSGTGSGRLNSRMGWTPATTKRGSEWFQIDSGEVQSIIGVVTQGRRDADIWVKEYSVKASIDGITWSEVQCGRLFKANVNRNSKVKKYFRDPIRARYLRIFPEEWQGSIGMRAGLIVCERPCTGGELDYHLDRGSLMSSTFGPSLDARWGDGQWDEQGWHFSGGEGLRVDQDEEGCMNNHAIKPKVLNTAYTIQITMKLNSVDGWKRIVGSQGWGETGLYVNKRLQMFPSAAMMKCSEILLPHKWYSIFVTRTDQGLLKLYINGAMCAKGRPEYNEGFSLHQHRIDFFHDDGSEHASGIVKDIHVWNRALSNNEILQKASCEAATRGKACSRTIVFSPPSSDFLYSSSYNNDKPGTGHARARLNSPQAWSANFPIDKQWLQIDTGKVQSISGVVVQGRRDVAQWVTAFYVDVSSDGSTWESVGCGERFEGSKDQHTKNKVLFYYPVRARYVRMKPAAYHSYPSMRAGALLCEQPCVKGELDYRFESSLLSSTQGPPLHDLGGEGAFQPGVGYTFSSTQGLILDQTYCITQPEEWSVYMDVRLDSTSGWRLLMSSKGWGDYGLYVNENLQMYPPAAGLKCAGRVHHGRFYQFIITRDTQGHVKLYLNGYLCADSYPPFLSGFKPDSEDVDFFRNPEGGKGSTSGTVKRIRLWDYALSDAEAANVCDCKMSAPASKCDRTVILNAPDDRLSYSSIWSNARKGQKYGAGRLDSSWSWSALHNKVDTEWMQIDTGTLQKIEGLVTQGRADYGQWVTSYKVMVSKDDKNWTDVECGFVFTANNNQHTKVTNLFDKVLEARFIRIFPQSWYGHMSMRAGAIICEQQCQGGQLDFKLHNDLASSKDGPSLTAPWGIGPWSQSNGYRFNKGQGFKLDAETCMNAGVYTIYMHVRFDDSNGHRRLVASQGWSDYGFYLWNRKFTLYPKSSEMTCAENVLANAWYHYVITRDNTGEVSMYLNGYKCAVGSPSFVDAFSINPENLQFLKDYGNNDGSGYVKGIRTWKSALDANQIAQLTGCTLNKPAPSSKCQTGMVEAVPYSRIKYSSTWSNDKKGTGHHGLGRLDSHAAWCAGSNNENQWFQLDAGSVTILKGVVTQGRNDFAQYVTSFRIDISSDGKVWEKIDCGRVFDGNTDRFNKIETIFQSPLEGRYVRIKPVTWYGHISMRAGLVVCEIPCESNELDYEFKDGFTSSLFGPALIPQWGAGTFASNKGYVFGSGQGLRLDEHRCIKKPEAGWTILVRGEVGYTNGWKRILKSKGWGDFGFYILNGRFTVFPESLNMKCPWKILPNQEVTYVFSRTEKGKVSMYQNGLKCAAATPPLANRFLLDPRNVEFFHDESGHKNTPGIVRRITMWNRVLGDTEIQDQSKCEVLEPVEKCDRYETISPDNSKYSSTGAWVDDPIGYRFNRPRLDSGDAWIPHQSRNVGAWLQMDSGKVQTIAGVVTQGRVAGNQYVTEFGVKVSTDGQTWRDVDCGNFFEGKNFQEKYTNMFKNPVEGRYIRIYPKAWHSYPSLRAGLLLCAAKCTNKELDYQFKRNLESSTSGPPLSPQWGAGSFTTLNDVREKGRSLNGVLVYRYNQGQGFEIDSSTCLKDQNEWSFIIQVRLDDASRFNRLLASEKWRRYGLFVKKNRLTMFPDDLDIACTAELFNGQMYQFAMTKKGGDVKLFVDGYQCASGSIEDAPAKGLALDLESIQFLHDPNGNDGYGYVQHIRMWGKQLSSGEVTKKCGCELATEGKECAGQIILNVADSDIKFDSVLGNNRVGTGWARGRLDSMAAWIAPNFDQGHWMQMDAGTVQSIAGVATQGRYGAGWWTSSFSVRVSDDEKDWKWVECGRRFPGNVNWNSRLDTVFEKPVKARYVRIYPVTFVGYPSLRAAMLICETKCQNSDLLYKFDGVLSSSTGGPSLTAPWGLGTYTTATWNLWLSTGDGYKFSQDQGLQLDESKCITDPQSYTVLIEAKLQATTGERAILTSEEWFDDGLFVADEIFQMRPSPDLQCKEPIRPGYTYKFAVTRSKKTGTVSLYLNGYKCASGKPNSNSGFTLESTNMIFFRGPNSHSSYGWVKNIEILDKTLSSSDILSRAGCELPEQESETCDDTVAFVPEISSYTASSIYANYKMGQIHYGQPRIGDAYAWSPDTNQCYGWADGGGCNKGTGLQPAGRSTWLQVDAGKATTIAGVITQGRGNYARWVKTFKLKVSDDGVEFKDVECGRIFDGNTDSNSKVKNVFALPVKARYVRFYPDTCYYNCDMRVGLLMCETACQSGHLDYKFTTGALASATGGPSMHAAWGLGTFDVNNGYVFRAGLGLHVDESKCVGDKETYSILISGLKLNQVDKDRAILTNDEWQENGLTVSDGVYVLKPTKLSCSEVIRPQYFYDLGITRSKKGEVALYINGYKCATGSPVSNEGFPLEENNIQFLRGTSAAQSASGSVKRIQIWNKELSSNDMADESSCELPEQTKPCDSTVEFVPNYDGYRASSIFSNYKMGDIHYGQPRLGDTYAWRPKTGTKNEWLQIDVGDVKNVAGVVTQGRGNYGRWIQTLTVKVSLKGDTWLSVECGRVFDANRDQSTKVDIMFDHPVKARYVRIYPDTWYYNIDLKAGALLCETGCEHQKLEYRLTSALTSVTSGPSLITPWGEGKVSPTAGYRFEKGAGLEVHESKCIEDTKTWSVLIDAKFDAVDQTRGLMTSPDWNSYGAYVKDGKFELLPTSIVCEREPVRTPYYYKFGITRTKEGNVTLFMNGYPCATGSPVSASGFALDPSQMIFMRGSNGGSGSGYVKDITLWQKTLTADEMRQASGCDLPGSYSRCSGTIQYSPAYAQYTASSIYANYKMGNQHYGEARIGDTFCWKAQTNTAGKEWLQIDLGKAQKVAGVVTQGRGNYDRWVQTYKVMVSQTGENWKYVECGRIFDGNTDRNTIVENLFDYPVKAQYVRIYPETFIYGQIDMRAGVVLCESTCSGGHLDYDFAEGMASKTGGPSLEAPWGIGKISPGKQEYAYRFSKEQGLEVDESNCIKVLSYWSVLMDVKLDQVDGYRSLFTSNAWKGNGPAVYDGVYEVKPTGLHCQEPIRTGYYYKFGATRNKDDQMTLYLNGYPCMTYEPTASKGFPLEATNMIFFKGTLGESSAGHVQNIQIWQKTLTADEMRNASKCELPEVSKVSCASYIYYSPKYEKYKASSFYGNYKMGWNHYGHPRLGESYCWRPKTNKAGSEWLQIDTGEVQAIAGVVVQGRSDYARWVKTFKVMVSQKGESWKWVECGRIFDGNKDQKTKVEVVFDKAVQARYVRIYPETAYFDFDLRAGVLLCEKKCDSNHLEYDLTSALTSETGGPSLRAIEGDGAWDGSRGYRFTEGQGLQVDESSCITSTKAYTIFIDARLDKVDGNRALVISDDWDTAGVYIENGLFRLLPSNIICDKEPIRPNYFYRFVVSREKQDGNISLYLNGYPCASGKPVSAKGFELDPDNVQFLRGKNKQSTAGYVKKIEMWGKSLTAEQIEKHSGCEKPSTKKQCTGFIQSVPPNEKWTASSIYANYKMGQDHYGRPRLDDTYAWLPNSQTRMNENGRSSQINNEWLQVDLEEVQGVAGIITQGRSNAWQYTQTYKVMVSQSGSSWKAVECGRIFDGNSNYYSKKQNIFSEVVQARYVRIYPETCYSYCALRVAILLCEKDCTDGLLDYKLETGSFKSESNGPMITAPWGEGRVDKNIGYRFSKSKGLQVDESACIEDPSVYSVLIDARLDEVDKDRSLMQSASWGPSGFYVGNSKLRWKPSSIICETEVIRSGQYYKFGATVDGKGKVTLYLNGKACASGTPSSGAGTRLDANNMIFFHGTGIGEDGKNEDLSSAGYVKRIRVWKKTLSAKDMATVSGCSMPPVGSQCKIGDIVHVPPHSQYKASSNWNFWANMGGGWCELPKINSAGGWCARYNNQDQWLQIDLKTKQDIVGLVTQGRAVASQFVKTFKVSVSDDGQEFTEVDCGRIFDGNSDENTKVRNYFTDPVKARYIRVMPMTWNGHCSMRLGALTCETKCSSSELDYEMQGSQSSTGGPILNYPWGAGIFVPKIVARGVNFGGSDLGFKNIDVDDCMKECKKMRNCVGVVQKSDENAKGCWPKFAMETNSISNSMDAIFRTDTLYYKLKAPYGYRVETNKGIQISPSACMNTKEQYTLIVEMRLDRVTGNAVRLIASKDWGQKGAYVYNTMFAIYPWFKGLKCQEDIKAGFFYKFGLTRTKDKKVSLYLNGWKCASAYPPYADAFSLDETSFSILHDGESKYNSAGWVRRIHMWKDAKSPTEMLQANDCKLSLMEEHPTTEKWEFCADQGQNCACGGMIRYGDTASDRWSGPHAMSASGSINCNDGIFGDPAWGVRKHCECQMSYVTINALAKNIKYSSVYDSKDGEFANGHGLGGTLGCWAPSLADMDEYLQIDFGKNKTIAMVSTQGDPRRAWQVTGFIVKVSYDGDDWLDVQCGRIWNTPWEGNSKKMYTVTFEKPVVAQFIRFLPVTWVNHPAMRVQIVGVKPPPPPPPPPSPAKQDDKKKDDEKKEEKGNEKKDEKEDEKKEISQQTLIENQLIKKDGTSLLNSYCANYRDLFMKSSLKNVAKVIELHAQCMNQDCAQSLEGGSKEQPGCRFRDDNGLCYAYNSAQMFCKDNAYVKNCNDGGEKWAADPLGKAESKLKTEWTPNENVAIFDSGEKTDQKFACACMKNCAIMGNKKSMMCSDGDSTKKAGAESIEFPETISKSQKNGQCVCRCGTKDILKWGVK